MKRLKKIKNEKMKLILLCKEYFIFKKLKNFLIKNAMSFHKQKFFKFYKIFK